MSILQEKYKSSLHFLTKCIVTIYLLLKSYSKYKIDRDRNIAHDTDKTQQPKT